jgi:hypothetical protein
MRCNGRKRTTLKLVAVSDRSPGTRCMARRSRPTATAVVPVMAADGES